eukprot:s5173_g3.t1
MAADRLVRRRSSLVLVRDPECLGDLMRRKWMGRTVGALLLLVFQVLRLPAATPGFTRSALWSAYEDLDGLEPDTGRSARDMGDSGERGEKSLHHANRKRASCMNALGNMRQSILTNCLMPQTRRRSSRKSLE